MNWNSKDNGLLKWFSNLVYKCVKLYEIIKYTFFLHFWKHSDYSTYNITFRIHDSILFANLNSTSIQIKELKLNLNLEFTITILNSILNVATLSNTLQYSHTILSCRNEDSPQKIANKIKMKQFPYFCSLFLFVSLHSSH